MEYIVHYKLFSDYENESDNREYFYKQTYEANNLDELDTILDEEEDAMDWDDSACLNWKAESPLVSTTRETIKITDNKGNTIKEF
jgi:hypothetical protein